MGFFSWKTADTNVSIPNIHSCRKTFNVYMITEDGRKWKEDNYDGYGVFGNQDIYLLISELNDLRLDESDTEDKDHLLRMLAIDLIYQDNPSGSFEIAASKGIKVPKLVESPNIKYSEAGHSDVCPDQGFFYDDDDADIDADWDTDYDGCGG
jgi:hypothetical protein